MRCWRTRRWITLSTEYNAVHGCPQGSQDGRLSLVQATCANFDPSDICLVSQAPKNWLEGLFFFAEALR